MQSNRLTPDETRESANPHFEPRRQSRPAGVTGKGESMYEIIKGVPIPKRVKQSECKYSFVNKMDIGDMFEAPIEEIKNIRSAFCYRGLGCKMRTQPCEKIIRVWRTK